MALANLCFFPDACMAITKYKPCLPFSFCGNLTISFPFRLKTDPVGCGYPWHELVCENNRTVLLTSYGKFFVENIFLDDYFSTIRLVDASLDRNSCSIPHSSFLFEGTCSSTFSNYSSTLYVLNCDIPMMNSSRYVDAYSCTNNSSPPYTYFCATSEFIRFSEFNELCIIEAQIPVQLSILDSTTGLSAYEVYRKLLQGFDVRFSLHDPSFFSFFVLNNLNYNFCPYEALSKEVTLKDRLQQVVYELQVYLDDLRFPLPDFLHGGDTYYDKIYGRGLFITTGTLILARVLLGTSTSCLVLLCTNFEGDICPDDSIKLEKQNNFLSIKYK